MKRAEMTGKQKRLTFSLGLLLMMMSLSCTSSVDKKATAAIKETTTRVKVKTLSHNTLPVTLKLSASTQADKDVILSAVSGGVVEHISVNVGDIVKKGQLIAKVNAAIAKAQYNAANSGFKTAESTYKRQKSLFRKKLISSQLYEAAKTHYETAKSQNDIANIQLSFANIKAPFDGVIAQKMAKQYEVLAPGYPVVNLIDLSKIRVTVSVNQYDIQGITKESLVRLSIPVLDITVTGNIDNIGVKADSRHKTFPVDIVFDNPNQQIKAGIVVDVEITLERYIAAIAIRKDYIIENNTENYVFVADQNRAKKVPVVIGQQGKDHVYLIKEGLSAGDKLIIEGHRQLKNNTLITIVD